MHLWTQWEVTPATLDIVSCPSSFVLFLLMWEPLHLLFCLPWNSFLGYLQGSLLHSCQFSVQMSLSEVFPHQLKIKKSNLHHRSLFSCLILYYPLERLSTTGSIVHLLIFYLPGRAPKLQESKSLLYSQLTAPVPSRASSTWHALDTGSMKPTFSHLKVVSTIPVFLTNCRYKEETLRRYRSGFRITASINDALSSHFCLPLCSGFAIHALVILHLHPASKSILCPSLPCSPHWEAESWGLPWRAGGGAPLLTGFSCLG